MVKVKENCVVYLNGVNSTLIKGTVYKKDNSVVLNNRDKFEIIESVKSVKSVKSEKEIPKKAKQIIKEEVKEVLLTEEPVAELKVEEVIEEKPKRRRRSKQD